jgi:hypothetical protein
VEKTPEIAVVPAQPATSAEASQADSGAEPVSSSTPAKKPARAKAAAKPAKKPAKKPQRRRTGPGGIYIPPPSEWF